MEQFTGCCVTKHLKIQKTMAISVLRSRFAYISTNANWCKIMKTKSKQLTWNFIEEQKKCWPFLRLTSPADFQSPIFLIIPIIWQGLIFLTGSYISRFYICGTINKMLRNKIQDTKIKLNKIMTVHFLLMKEIGGLRENLIWTKSKQLKWNY